MGVACGEIFGGTFVMSSNCAVRLNISGCCLPLESVSSNKMCVGWLTMADVRPGPLT